ncbi:hypothetical protein BJF78_10125 [Pseudonocardia sp. CNS-139]|nr:hypothetical protein BJF78_10125 [Pseudonocardia sp. CNS-139]
MVAREVLLDSLDALVEHASAITVVGAQAIYLRSADVDLTVATFTSDADFSVDPDLLESEPLLQQAMTAAGFMRKDRWPGQWYASRRVGSTTADIGVDLLVPMSVAGRPGKRGVDIPPHDKRAAGKADGLEAALLDADVMDIATLRPVGTEGHRVRSARVAGPAALLVAKAHKIAERREQLRPLENKDSGDVVRLMMATDPDDVASRFQALLKNERTAMATAAGIAKLRGLFGGVRTVGTLMAVKALAGDPIEDQIASVVGAYLEALPDIEDT